MTGKLSSRFSGAVQAAGLVAVMVTGLAACSDSPSNASDDPSSGPSSTSASATETPSAAPAAESRAPSPEGPEVVDQFVAAINAGDANAVAALFANDARFDSVGRIYEGRDEIIGNFLVPEVIEVGGQYELLGTTAGERGRIVAEYDFVTDSGHQEHFTYDCEIIDQRFTDCVGDYV